MANSDLVYGQVVIRRNVWRRSDNSRSVNDLGVLLKGCEEAIVEKNLLSVSVLERGVRHSNCPSLSVFGNTLLDGTLLRGYDSTTQARDPELTTDVEAFYFKE